MSKLKYLLVLGFIPLLAACQAAQPVTTKPITEPTKPLAECRKTGCSGQVCSDQDLVTTCEMKPEYACYQQARCERQTNGQCGFTETTELNNCLQAVKQSVGQTMKEENKQTTTAPAVVTVSVNLGEWFVKMSPAVVKQGSQVKFVVKNTGQFRHDFALGNTTIKTKLLAPGETTEVTWVADQAGRHEVICAVPGHAENGMAAYLDVN